MKDPDLQIPFLQSIPEEPFACIFCLLQTEPFFEEEIPPFYPMYEGLITNSNGSDDSPYVASWEDLTVTFYVTDGVVSGIKLEKYLDFLE